MDEVTPATASPLRNVTGGLGCGSGCLGLLMVGGALLALAGIPLELYEDGPGTVPILAGGGLVAGLLVSTLGATAWVGSLFMD